MARIAAGSATATRPAVALKHNSCWRTFWVPCHHAQAERLLWSAPLAFWTRGPLWKGLEGGGKEGLGLLLSGGLLHGRGPALISNSTDGGSSDQAQRSPVPRPQGAEDFAVSGLAF
jgi:hypothetical protein